jgi:hypothetical protein
MIGAMSTMKLDITPGDELTKVVISGVIDEHADLSALAAIESRVEIDLEGIRRFNSVGIRNWVDAMRDLRDNARSVTFVACAPPVIDQLNMISGFLANGMVRSFYAPMLCPHCDTETTHLFETGTCRELDRLPKVLCPECKLPMELDDNEDTFLLFIREPTRVGSRF